MYTRCPSCNSTFRVTATVLQMADGEVRCGSCGVVFNALHTLVDDWSGADFTLPGAPRLSHPGEPAPAGPPRDDPASGEPSASDTLEFDVPENEWQRYFITPVDAPARAAPRTEPGLGDAFDPAAAGEEPASEVPGDAVDDVFEDADPADESLSPRSVEEETADTDTWQAFLREAEAGEAHSGPGEDDEDNEPLFVLGEIAGAQAEARILIRRQPERAPAPAMESPGEPERQEEPGDWPEDVPTDNELDAAVEELAEAPLEATTETQADGARARRPAASTVLDWGPPPAFPEPAVRPPAHAGRWLAASAVAALALAGQAAHYYRDTLAADPGYGAAVRDAYARIGLRLNPGWPLDAYEIRGAKAIAENSAPGALDIVAEIAVTGPQAVGLPVVRVVLRDRWSNPIGSGVFDAPYYLAETPPTSGVYSPGSLIPVQISLKDPGSAAQGYELDVCVPDRQLGLQCKTARDPFRR